MKKYKYRLTFWQKLELPLLRLFWLMADPKDRKTWHEVKKGMEKHEHNFCIHYSEGGYDFLKCSHPGCNLCDPID